ncbi:MAG: phytanoyl-CoA dioxygenase family protein [Gammaproteobacteria bacterium]|nr:phytanoyl-CoA dioxygenase family protein [Gammaproteobacteria bacterium]
MAQEIQRRVSTIYEPPELGCQGELLSDTEIEYFKTNGFLFKRQLLDSVAATAAMDRIWEALLNTVPLAADAKQHIRREDPDSWRAPAWAPMPSAEISGFFEGRQRTVAQGRTVKMHEIGAERYLLDLVPNNERVTAIARLLLADKLKTCERTRGVYALFPPARLSEQETAERISGASLGPHTDRVCQQLNVCAYLEDVPPRSGGFTVYPGSHRIMFNAHEYESNWSPKLTFRSAMREVVANITPVEFVGSQGDVVFWHGRTVHSAGIHIGETIRWAVFADFNEAREVLDAEGHRALGQYEWFKDAKLFKEDFKASDDMWRSWRLGR